jgi:hypothetical protein
MTNSSNQQEFIIKEIPLKYPEKLPDLKPGEIRGRAWSAWPADGLYFFEFLEAMHGGRARKLALIFH